MAYRGSVTLAVLLVAAEAAFAEPDHAKNRLTALSGSIRELTNRVAPAVVELVINGYTAADDDSGQTGNQISWQRSSGSGVIDVETGAVIHAINTLRAVSVDAFQSAVKELAPGDVVLQIERDGRFQYVAFEIE